jgi:membrane protease YdiL (CAAX protease family)
VSSPYAAAIPAPQPALLVQAWVIAIVFGSIAPDVFFRVALRTATPRWASLPAQAAGLALLLIMTWILPSITPLRWFVWSLLLIQVGYLAAFTIGGSSAWSSFTHGMSPGKAFIATEMLKTIPTLTLALSLVGTGLDLREVFVTPGDLNATAQPTFLTGAMPWTRLGPILLVLFAAPLALYVMAARGSQVRLASAAAGIAAWIVLGSAVNAFNEELIFRAVLLARLAPVIGAGHALWLTTARFGIGHWFGNPGGATGVGMAAIAGWFWGKSILETRGLFWAWLIHAAQDVIIYSLIAMRAG